MATTDTKLGRKTATKASKTASKKTATKAASKAATKAAKTGSKKTASKKTATAKAASKAAKTGSKKTATKAATKAATKPAKTGSKKTASKTASKAASTSATAKSASKKSASKKSASKKSASKKSASKKTSTTKTATTHTATTKASAASKKPAAARPAKQAGLLPADVEKSLLAKLRKADYEHEVERALESLVPASLTHADVLWDLALRGRLPLDRDGVASEFMDWPAPSPEALVTMWSRFQPAWIKGLATQLPGAPSFLFAIVYKAIEADPAPWAAAVEGLPEPLRAVVWLELAELEAAEVPPAVIADLRARVLTDPFDPSRSSVVDNLTILGLDEPTIARELLQRVPAEGVALGEVEIVLSHAEVAALTKILGAARLGWRDGGLIGRILRGRDDSIDALVGLAGALRAAHERSDERDRCVQAIVDVALERAQAENVAPPAAIDAFVTFAWERSPYAAPGLAALPRDRLLALIRRELAAEGPAHQRHRVFPALRFAFDEGLFAELLAEARAAVQRSLSRANSEPIALGMIGPPAIPALERALSTALADTTFERDYYKNRWVTQLRKAIAVALLLGSHDGEAVDERWDALLGPHPECLDWNIIDEVFNGGRLFGELLDALPEPRARAIVDAWLAADPNGKHNVRDWIERELSESRAHLLAPAEPLIDRLRRLVVETGLTPDTRIYALERHEECDPAAVNRVCSAPLGLADDRWPRHKKAKMEHVLTIDLDQAPELRRLAPQLASARAAALFISSRDDNQAWSADNDETELIGLSAEELAAGHDEEGGSFSVHALDVPSAVFGEKQEGPLGELRSAVWKLDGRALGAPYWVQGDEWYEPLLLQFDESLASINLGDSGVMYVFPGAAFWQCY